MHPAPIESTLLTKLKIVNVLMFDGIHSSYSKVRLEIVMFGAAVVVLSLIELVVLIVVDVTLVVVVTGLNRSINC